MSGGLGGGENLNFFTKFFFFFFFFLMPSTGALQEAFNPQGPPPHWSLDSSLEEERNFA